MMPRCIVHPHAPSHECIVHHESAHGGVTVGSDGAVTKRDKILNHALSSPDTATIVLQRTRNCVHSIVHCTLGGVLA
jgi:hypothetical protein